MDGCLAARLSRNGEHSPRRKAATNRHERSRNGKAKLPVGAPCGGGEAAFGHVPEGQLEQLWGRAGSGVRAHSHGGEAEGRAAGGGARTGGGAQGPRGDVRARPGACG